MVCHHLEKWAGCKVTRHDGHSLPTACAPTLGVTEPPPPRRRRPMTNPTTPTDAVRDPSSDPSTDSGADTAPIGWATTRTMPYAAPADAAPAPTPATAPALNPPVWSGRKTAIAAAL